MVTLAQIIIDRAAAGLHISVEEIESIPAIQWEIYGDELRAICPSKIDPRPVRQRNALRIEVLPSSDPRCSRRDPDGRGLAWLMSGGDPIAYGVCCCAACPRAKATKR